MEIETTKTTKGINLNKPAYIVFVVVGLAFLIAKDISQAVIFLGLALVFDPFDIKMPFDKRPFYQRAWLIIHLAITLVLIAFEVIKVTGK